VARLRTSRTGKSFSSAKRRHRTVKPPPNGGHERRICHVECIDFASDTVACARSRGSYSLWMPATWMTNYITFSPSARVSVRSGGILPACASQPDSRKKTVSEGSKSFLNIRECRHTEHREA